MEERVFKTDEFNLTALQWDQERGEEVSIDEGPHNRTLELESKRGKACKRSSIYLLRVDFAYQSPYEYETQVQPQAVDPHKPPTITSLLI